MAIVYILFRNIPVRLIAGLFYLIPVLVAVQIIYGYNHLTEPWQGIADITGMFNNTGIFGGFVAMGFIATLGLILSSKPKRYYIDKILLGIILVPIPIQLICSQSRAAWLAAVAGVIVLLFPIFRKLTKFKAIAFVAILLIIGILFSAKLYHFKKDSADGRLLIWTVSWNLFKEKPFSGFGPNGFQKNYMLRQGDYLNHHSDSPWIDLADDTTSPFNEFLKIGIEQGIIGLIFSLGIIFITAKSKARTEQTILTALIIFSCFSYPFSFIHFQILLIICLAGIASKQKSLVFFKKLQFNPAIMNLFIYLFIIISGITCYSFCKYQHAVKQWKNASTILDDKTIPQLQSLYPTLKNNALFISIYGSALYFKRQYSEAIPRLEEAMKLYPNTQTLLRLGESYEKTGSSAQALKAWETAVYMKPSSFTPIYNMAKLYLKQQDYEQAKQKANEILNKKIKVDHPKISRMKEEMQAILNYI